MQTHLGVLDDDLTMIRRGAVVKTNDRYICIRDNQVKVTVSHPYACPNILTPFQIEIEAELGERRLQTDLEEMR